MFHNKEVAIPVLYSTNPLISPIDEDVNDDENKKKIMANLASKCYICPTNLFFDEANKNNSFSTELQIAVSKEAVKNIDKIVYFKTFGLKFCLLPFNCFKYFRDDKLFDSFVKFVTDASSKERHCFTSSLFDLLEFEKNNHDINFISGLIDGFCNDYLLKNTKDIEEVKADREKHSITSADGEQTNSRLTLKAMSLFDKSNEYDGKLGEINKTKNNLKNDEVRRTKLPLSQKILLERSFKEKKDFSVPNLSDGKSAS